MINCAIHTGRRLALLAILLMLFGAYVTFHVVPMDTVAYAAQSATKDDEKRLIGRLVRPDGGYVLELKEIKKDGTLKAAYFNPRPINIARSELSRKDGMLTVFVELRGGTVPPRTASPYNDF